MEQDNPEEPIYLRHRSPTFSKDEIQTFVNLVSKYKNVINNRSCSNVTLHAKEIAWAKIAKAFNSHGFKHHRNVECLKIKWDNLKKDARKVSKNLMDGQGDFDNLTRQIVTMVCEAENNTSDISHKDLEEEFNEEDDKESKEISVKYWDNSGDKEENKTDGENQMKDKYIRFKRRINRSMNFTPQDCRLLLQCVRREKKYVFSKGKTARSLALKRRAWFRITNMFNKQSTQKRSTLMLRNKIWNMKRLGSLLPENNKDDEEDYSQFGLEDNYEKVKSEPGCEDMDQDDNVNDIDVKDDSNSDQNGDNSLDGLEQAEHMQLNLVPDPLSTILNGDSGIGSITMDGFDTGNSEVTKLKIELLKYQLETAKLERKRIEDAARAEGALNESRAIEAALRLRAARLRALGAAAALPPHPEHPGHPAHPGHPGQPVHPGQPTHPALRFPASERRAQLYLEQCAADST